MVCTERFAVIVSGRFAAGAEESAQRKNPQTETYINPFHFRSDMVKRTGSRRRKTRQQLTKSKRDKGKLPVTAFLKQFSAGDKVLLKAEPSYHKGLFFPRFQGKIGTISDKRGRCYEVIITDGKKGMEKMIIVNPVHLKKA